jgi:phosphatidylserine/phosphatidylglycerophosphate/cardiolipin synthase-like enzyme
MRFKSDKIGGFQVFAVAGTNTVSFGIDFDPAKIAGLMGFAVERHDIKENERYYMYGFKVFASIYPNPDTTLLVSTFDQPIQSFVWDDFTAKDGREYVYYFHPLKGTPKNLDRSAPAIPIRIRTEKAFSNGAHDIFFNRGVASSQAYARKFNNKRPDKLPEPKRGEALQWLSRDLDEALQKFIEQAKPGDTLLGAFYEFRYAPAAQWFKAAIDRGVDVKLVIDAKKNGGGFDKKGKPIPNFPRDDNMKTVADAGLPAAAIACWREKNTNEIAHNKFIVLLKGAAKAPTQVWTGSTNLSDGGIHGQTNVGHWVRDATVAGHFKDYWTLLSGDPGKSGTGTPAEEKAAMNGLRSSVAALLPTPTDWRAIPQGVTPVFSPRAGGGVLDMYSIVLDESDALGCITLAFGISAVFKGHLVTHSQTSPLTFLMLEKKDAPPKPKPGAAPKPFVALGWRQNVYSAWGSFIEDALYRWTRETNAGALGLNQHVSYIHSKFLLHDPLGADPIVVTGSANFSTASTNDNDENMLLIRGETRVADIYFTEFNRLFFHYYFRSVHEAISEHKPTDAVGVAATAAAEKASLFLDETAGWISKYAPGSLKTKRVKIFTAMAGAKTI